MKFEPGTFTPNLTLLLTAPLGWDMNSHVLSAGKKTRSLTRSGRKGNPIYHKDVLRNMTQRSKKVSPNQKTETLKHLHFCLVKTIEMFFRFVELLNTLGKHSPKTLVSGSPLTNIMGLKVSLGLPFRDGSFSQWH